MAMKDRCGSQLSVSASRPPHLDGVVVADTDQCFMVMRVERDTVDHVFVLKC